jgi:hypothetical protein
MDWRKSTYTGNGGATCVETATGHGVILVRDTTNRDGGALSIPVSAWRSFMMDVKRR